MEESCGTEHLRCKLEKRLLVCMMIGVPFACSRHVQVPHLESSLGGRRRIWGIPVFPAYGGRGCRGKEVVHRGYSFISCPLHAMPGCLSGGLGLEPSLLLTPADAAPFSPQTQAPPCLQTPRPRAQAQSPLCRPHSEEPARHLSPSPPMDIKVPGTALSPPLGPFPSLESSSLRKESSSCPSKAPTMPVRGMHFYIGLFKDFC